MHSSPVYVHVAGTNVAGSGKTAELKQKSFIPEEKKRGCKITACEKRRIPGKGSSVDIFSVFSLWNPFSDEKGHIDHIPGKVWISWG